MNTDNAYKFLRKHSPILFKWIMEPDMPAGIDEAIAEVMTAFAREACEEQKMISSTIIANSTYEMDIGIRISLINQVEKSKLPEGL